MPKYIGTGRVPLNVKIAYPGELGPKIPSPPAGYVPYGTGYEAMNRAGDMVEWNGTSWVAV